MRKLILLLFAIMPAIAFGQGFQVNLHGQKQIGMGHTGTGLLQDGASVLFNPGAVAMLPQNYVQAGMSPLLFKSDFNPSGSTDQYRTKNKIATPFTAYGVWGPKDARWKIGLGVYTPYGGLTDWGQDWAGKYSLESLNLKAIYFQPTLSYRVTDFLSLGAGFVYNHGTVDLTRAIPVTDASGNDGQAQLKGSGHGFGWNAGAFIKTNVGLTIGLDYRSQVNTTVKNGDAIFKVASSIQPNFPQPNTFTTTLPLPSTSSIGLGYKPSNKWTVAVDVNFTKWDVYKTLGFDYAKNTPTLQDTYSPRNYKNGWSYRAGAEYKATDKIFVRGGGGYVTTAVKDGYVTPEAPDANRYYLTAGLGYKVTKSLDLDVSFEYEHLDARTQTNIESQLSGTFKTNVYIPGLSLAYHW
ncbi:long-chain fatty acid transport protein [Mucilaginibacter sp. OK268]|uniref:OmpP1/FadL family transporter n=1 Tax=Mucilaginibacter sp. OK268 TaxID=1881048 RepID=UPI000891CD63|nr:outer membrane protein transport protein [Mucilaginibacter sp. OK268]SDP60519.1 long-chain fatty acid transport protein [Mucilaginibacter sp. OK268]